MGDVTDASVVAGSKSFYPITTEMVINQRRFKVSTHAHSWENAKKACIPFKGKIGNLRKMNEINSLAKLPQGESRDAASTPAPTRRL